MDMWKPFRNAKRACATNAGIVFDKFHVLRHLGEAMDKVRKREYARLSGQERRLHQGAEVHAAFALGESDRGEPRGYKEIARGE